MPQGGSNRTPKSDAHRILGEKLRQLRQTRGLTLRELGADVYTDGHLSNVENGHVTPSPALLQHYVRSCGGDYAQLHVLLQAIHRVGEQVRKERHAVSKGLLTQALKDASRYDPPDPAQLYAIDSIETHASYDGEGIPLELRVIIKIRARVAGLDRYYFGIGCHGDYRPGVVKPESSFGCMIGDFKESKLGVINGYFLLDRELSPMDPEPHVFSFRILYNTDRRVERPIISQPKTDTAHMAMHVRFTSPSLPSKTWWYDAATAVEIGDDQPESNVLATDAGGYYFREWTSLIIGRCYGIDWQW